MIALGLSKIDRDNAGVLGLPDVGSSRLANRMLYNCFKLVIVNLR